MAARTGFYSADEREVLALLFLPFLLVATVISLSQALRQQLDFIAAIVAESERPGPDPWPSSRSIASAPLRPLRAADPALPALPSVPAGPALTARALDQSAAEVALLPTAPELPAREPEAAGLALALPRGAAQDVCMATPRRNSGAVAPASVASLAEPGRFGIELAAAARGQLAGLVVYNDKYRNISYPHGDVPAFYGVCTDVVVRAYRALGVDLQALVHRARVGSGDTNIDHRRTEILRRFFAAFGERLPVTGFADDYWPGDIVTYYRPQNRGSRSHIAIVADVVAPSGRPMIIHNRGWGPQMEDALFVDEITGHYRYSGSNDPVANAKRDTAQKATAAGKAIPNASVPPVLRASFAPPTPEIPKP